jgi:hypothetical protein
MSMKIPEECPMLQLVTNLFMTLAHSSPLQRMITQPTLLIYRTLAIGWNHNQIRLQYNLFPTIVSYNGH